MDADFDRDIAGTVSSDTPEGLEQFHQLLDRVFSGKTMYFEPDPSLRDTAPHREKFLVSDGQKGLLIRTRFERALRNEGITGGCEVKGSAGEPPMTIPTCYALTVNGQG